MKGYKQCVKMAGGGGLKRMMGAAPKLGRPQKVNAPAGAPMAPPQGAPMPKKPMMPPAGGKPPMAPPPGAPAPMMKPKPGEVAMAIKKGGMIKKAKGGHIDAAEDKKMIKKAVNMHDDQLHGGKKTNLSKLACGGMTRPGMKKG